MTNNDNMKTTNIANLWALACAHDGIDPDSPFAVFSDDNPWTDALDKSRSFQPTPIERQTP